MTVIKLFDTLEKYIGHYTIVTSYIRIARIKFCERSRETILVARRQCIVTINAGACRNEM